MSEETLQVTKEQFEFLFKVNQELEKNDVVVDLIKRLFIKSGSFYLAYIETCYLKKYGTSATKYWINDFKNIQNLICKHYNLEFFPCSVRNDISQNVWGPMFWANLHTTTILYQKLIYDGIIPPTSNKLPKLIQNMEAVLFCSICSHHFSSTKTNNKFTNNLKLARDKIAFGAFVYGGYVFHNEITENINKTLKYKRNQIAVLDFANYYGVYPNDIDGATQNFVKLPILYLPTPMKILYLASVVDEASRKRIQQNQMSMAQLLNELKTKPIDHDIILKSNDAFVISKFKEAKMYLDKIKDLSFDADVFKNNPEYVISNYNDVYNFKLSD